MWLVAGLGNPGDKYEATRHNVGYMVADYLKDADPHSCFKAGFSGVTAKVEIAGQPVILLKPETFMNLSGQSVQPAAAYYKIAPEKVIVVHDDIDLPFGAIRLKQGGGHGGHNGIRDIIGRMGPNFARVKLGIGRPAFKGTEASFVLKKFRKDEQDQVNEQIYDASKAIEMIIKEGLVQAQQVFNRNNNGKTK